MAGEKVAPQTELSFFSYILANPLQFQFVEPSFFKVDELQFVYKLIHDYYLAAKVKRVPSNDQIVGMVKINDPENKISDNALRTILKNQNDTIEKEWIENRFRAWKISNAVKERVFKSVELIRSLDDINITNVLGVTSELENLYKNLLVIDNTDEDLGSDFYDPESHKQNVNVNKIKTGWSSLDNVLTGGWDTATLNVIMGETNIGKSMWLHNIASNTIKAGRNVLVLTLEMAEYKCTKRMGSMLLGIPPSLYEEKSNDTQYMINKLKSFKNTAITNNLFNSKVGELFVKKFNTSDCTVTDIDNYIMKVQDNKQFKVDMVIVDYLNIMSLEKGLDIKGNLYQKGKHIAEGLRYLAGKHNITFITATQTDRAVWGASDIKMDAVPESKAIVETADTVWAIIRTTEMKRQNLYRLKNLKLRDGECKEQQVKFTFKPETLTMENDLLVVD
jgi:replicative DNA helicase